MASETFVRLNPRHHRLASHRFGEHEDDFITHEPKALAPTKAKKVLESTYRGHPLAVEVKKSEAEADDAGESEEASD